MKVKVFIFALLLSFGLLHLQNLYHKWRYLVNFLIWGLSILSPL